jgi:multiple sugar transport system permease protein
MGASKNGLLLQKRGGHSKKKQLGRVGFRHPVLRGLLYVFPFGIMWGIFLAWPVLYGLYISMFKWIGLEGSEFVGFANFKALFNEPRFWNALLNTFEFALLSIPLIMGLGLGFALLVWSWQSRLGQKASGVIQSALFFPWLLTVAIVAMTWQWLFDWDYGLIQYALQLFGLKKIGFLSSSRWVLPSIAIGTAWWLVGYRMLVFIAGLQDIPDALFDCARLDGAKPRHNFFHIILPLMRPSLLFSLVLTILAGFRSFGQMLIMTEGGPGRSSEVLALYLYKTGFEYFELGKAAASGVVLLVFVLTLTLLGVKFIGLKSELQ